MSFDFLRCIGCGELNQPQLVSCQNPECRINLRHAEPVYEVREAQDGPYAGSVGQGRPDEPCTDEDNACISTCVCDQPLDSGDGEECGRCGGSFRGAEDGDTPEPIARPVPQLSTEWSRPPEDRDAILPRPVRVEITILDTKLICGAEGLMIGRDETVCEVDSTKLLRRYQGVSRKHVWVGVDTDSVLVMDVGSRNGTWILGGRLTPFRAFRMTLERLPLTIWIGARVQMMVTAL